MQRAFRLSSNQKTLTSSFQDISGDALYTAAAEAILEAGVTRGCGVDPLRYCPDDTVRRDTMAAFLARALRTADSEKVLGLAPDRDILSPGVIGDRIWAVWVCESAPIREDPVAYFNREVSSYYRWLSGGKYRMRFEYGADPSPAVSEVLDNCENVKHSQSYPSGANVFVGGDLWTLGQGVVGVGSGWFDAGIGRFVRNVWMDKRAMYDTTGYAHEIGHASGWPHNLKAPGGLEALRTGMDIMAGDRHLVGTNAHHLFHLGWIEPRKVASHPGGAATYSITPPFTDTGLELLILPSGSSRFISVGARVKEEFDQNIRAEGVELYEIRFCGTSPGCKHVFLPPGAPSEEAVVLDVGDSWAARIATVREGRGSLVDLEVSVTGRHNRTYTVAVDETSTGIEFSSFGVGRAGVCGLLEDGGVHCWDWWGEDPTPPQGPFTSLGIGHQGCGIRADGAIRCWGWDNDGSNPPDGDFEALSVNGYHGCDHRPDRTVECWGSDAYLRPVGETPSGDFISVSAGWSHACGVSPDKTVQCWGSDYAGETSPPTARRPAGVATATASLLLPGASSPQSVSEMGAPVG